MEVYCLSLLVKTMDFSPKLLVYSLPWDLWKGIFPTGFMKNYPQLGKRYSGKPFGDIGYAAFNSGHVTNEMIQEYLKDQENHLNYRDDNFLIEWLSVITQKLLACSFQSALAEAETFSL